MAADLSDTGTHPEAAASQTGAPSAADPLAPVTGLIEWLAKVWAPLGAYTVVLVVAYWFEFRRVYAIPVSFVSSATIGALPALGGMVLGSVCVLAGFVLLPSVALWMPVGADGRRLIDAHDAEDQRFRWAFWRSRNLGRVWLAVQGLFAIWVTGALVALAVGGAGRGLIQVVAVGAPVLFALVALHASRVRAGIRGWGAVAFNLTLGWAMLIQSLVVIEILRVAVGFIHGLSTTSVLGTVIGAAVIIVAVTGQFVVAVAVQSNWRRVGYTWVVCGVLGLSTLPLGAPDLGARLVAMSMRVSDPDGKPCVVLLASSKAIAADWAGLSADPTKLPGKSLGLPFATLLDAYHVKVTESGPTFSIPADQVRGIDRCDPLPAARSAASVAGAVHVPVAAQVPAQHAWMWTTGDIITAMAAAVAAALSLVSIVVALRTHRQAHRPLVTVRIRTHSGGSNAIALDIVVENTGNRPAFDVRVRARRSDIDAALVPGADCPADIERILVTGGIVPVLANGRAVSNAFGFIGTEAVWRAGASIPVEVHYRGGPAPAYAEQGRLYLADTIGFSQSSWGVADETTTL